MRFPLDFNFHKLFSASFPQKFPPFFQNPQLTNGVLRKQKENNFRIQCYEKFCFAIFWNQHVEICNPEFFVNYEGTFPKAEFSILKLSIFCAHFQKLGTLVL